MIWRFSRFFSEHSHVESIYDGVLDPSNFTSLLIWLLQGNETLRTFPDALFESATKESNRRTTGQPNLPCVDVFLSCHPVRGVLSHRPFEIQAGDNN